MAADLRRRPAMERRDPVGEVGRRRRRGELRVAAHVGEHRRHQALSGADELGLGAVAGHGRLLERRNRDPEPLGDRPRLVAEHGRRRVGLGDHRGDILRRARLGGESAGAPLDEPEAAGRGLARHPLEERPRRRGVAPRKEDPALRLVEEHRRGVRRNGAPGVDDGLRLVGQAACDERLDRDRERLVVRPEAVDARGDLARQLDGLVHASVGEPQPDLRHGVVDDVLELRALGGVGKRRPGLLEPPELEQDLAELEGGPPADLRARAPLRRRVRLLGGVEGFEHVAPCAADPALRNPDHVRDHRRARLGFDLLDSVADPRHHQVQPGPGLVVRDVVCDEGVAGPLRLLEGLVQRRHRLDGAARVDERERDPRPGPESLELRSGGARDLDGLLGHLEAVLVVELELVEAGEPDVREREVGRRAVLLQDAPCVLRLLVRQVGAALLPTAAPEDEPRPRGLDRRGLPVHPEHAAHVGEQTRADERVAHVRERVVEELERLAERERRLRMLGRLYALWHRLVEAGGAEQMARHLVRLGARGEEDVGRPAVDLLPAREHDLVVDGLLRQRVSPAVGGAGGVDLLQELLRHTDGERVVHGRVGDAGDGDERRVVELPPEDGGGLEDLDVHGLEPREPEQDGVADRLGNSQLLELPRLPAVAGADDVAAVDRLLQHLLEHERVPLRPPLHEVAELGRDRLRVEDRRDHLRDLAAVERRQRDRLGHARPAPRLEERRERMPPVELVASVRDEDERPHAGQAAGQVVEELARRRVRPVDVLDDEEQAVLARRDREQCDDGLEEPELRLRGIAERRRRLVAAELREELGELEPRGAEQARKPFHVLAGQVVAEFHQDQRRRNEAAGRVRHVVGCRLVVGVARAEKRDEKRRVGETNDHREVRLGCP